VDVSFPTFRPVPVSVLTSPFRYNPISIADFNTTIYSILFKSQSTLATNDEPNVVVSHRLSVMFMVLAIGSLMDTRLASYNIEAEKYHQLARAALFQNHVFDEPTLGAVQALYLMSFYLFFSDRHGTSGGSRWAIMGMAAKLGQSVSSLICRWMCSSALITNSSIPRSDFVSHSYFRDFPGDDC
jgi:Fungal specific transcription factor domain